MNSSLIATRFLSLGIAVHNEQSICTPLETVRLRLRGEYPGTKEVKRALGRTEIGVIYPDLPWLMRFNSHPINADRYVIG